MILPHTKKEEKILSDNKNAFVIGVDEAGRGPLAGPVVAGAVWINPEILQKNFPEKKLIRDSKSLSEKQRKEIFSFMQKSENFILGFGEVSAETIDEINILQATLLAMRLAVEGVVEKLKQLFPTSTLNNIHLLIDGNQKIKKLNFSQETISGGDQSVFSIAAASILAKIHRDDLMEKYHQQFPFYGFDKHKGYGTTFHLEQLRKNGPCLIHRRSFKPVRKFFES